MRCNKENVGKLKIQVIFKIHGTLTNIYYDRYLRIWYVSRPDQIFERILKNDKMNKKTIGTKRLLVLTKAVRILLYSQLLKWNLPHDLKITAIYKLLENKSSGFLKNYLVLKDKDIQV